MIDAKGTNSRYIKNRNRYVILEFVRVNGPVTKAEIADKTDLTFTAINNIVEQLTQEGYIRETGYAVSSGGRKPVLLDINSEAVYTVGVQLNTLIVKTAVVNFKGVPVIQEEAPIFDLTDRDAIVGVIIAAIETLISRSGLTRDKLAGIGVASPGPLDPNQGVILSPPNLPGLAAVPLRQVLEDKFRLPVKVEKDANVMALSELWYGACRGLSNIVYIDADLGIGSGIILGRQIYSGFPYGAGEIGHGTIDLDGPRCNCGNFGCLEAVASGMAVVRRAGEEIRRGAVSSLSALYRENEQALDISAVIEAAKQQDPLAIRLLGESARYVGIALANVINLLAPEAIVVGGLLANDYPPYYEQVRGIALERSFASIQNAFMLRPSELKHLAGVIGAGTLPLERYLLSE